MQDELDSEGYAIQILGINHIDKIQGNEGMVLDKDLPWLQDTAEQDVWSSWGPTYRDVIILDSQNNFVAAFNLTLNQLSDSENRSALKALLVGQQSPTNDSGLP